MADSTKPGRALSGPNIERPGLNPEDRIPYFPKGSTRLHREALAYAERGIAIHPLGRRSKIPLKGTHSFHDATTDVDRINAWWAQEPEANIGLPTGARGGRVVIEIDPRHGGDESLRDLEAEYGPLPDTPRVLSGRGDGGTHYYFRHPGPGISIKSSAGELAPGIDVKADGGQVVAPPSIHKATGQPYQWDAGAHIDDLPLADLPDWLLAKLTEAKPRPQLAVESDDWTIPAGQRNNELLSIAGRLRRQGHDEEEIAALLLKVNKRCRPEPLPEAEVLSIARSACRYPPGDSPRPQNAACPPGVAGTPDDPCQGEIAQLRAELTEARAERNEARAEVVELRRDLRAIRTLIATPPEDLDDKQKVHIIAAGFVYQDTEPDAAGYRHFTNKDVAKTAGRPWYQRTDKKTGEPVAVISDDIAQKTMQLAVQHGALEAFKTETGRGPERRIVMAYRTERDSFADLLLRARNIRAAGKTNGGVRIARTQTVEIPPCPNCRQHTDVTLHGYCHGCGDAIVTKEAPAPLDHRPQTAVDTKNEPQSAVAPLEPTTKTIAVPCAEEAPAAPQSPPDDPQPQSAVAPEPHWVQQLREMGIDPGRPARDVDCPNAGQGGQT